MKTCLRCGERMLEGLRLRTGDGYDHYLSEKGLFKGSLGEVLAAACPKCGHIELYVEDPAKLSRLAEQHETL